MDPISFQRKWIGVELKERSASQEHFFDLCRVLDVPTPADSARNLDTLRQNWLNPQDATEADLKKRTLTTLYNQRPTWLAMAHTTLDRAVWAAYSWPDPDPATVEEDTTLSRLLALNLARSNQSSSSAAGV